MKFTQDAKAEIADLASKLNGTLVSIGDLNKHAPAGEMQSAQAKADVFQATQTVSDQTAQLTGSLPCRRPSQRRAQTAWLYMDR
ncbi:hypothetical protein IGB42_03599 [Andreprevotia sp. IGB-42]|uniref:hypothetical protein n=1 Tax=Andreprevotia sp. IGB-42 TaxID=2497473 RepID=UPI001357A3F7|nr:hypothetical protein [Andreprevotia sp. IGB-42]KAF0811792.1 hypothetical protein IGB42_03599 [Andreprevotia sp. IGB-42]